MHVSTSQSGDTTTIRLEGALTFEVQSHFRNAIKAALEVDGVKHLVLDIAGVDYMDSSALGMLLLTRDKAQARNAKVTLLNPTPTVKAILNVVQFGDMFDIQG